MCTPAGHERVIALAFHSPLERMDLAVHVSSISFTM